MQKAGDLQYLSRGGRVVVVGMEWAELAAVAVREVEPAVRQSASQPVS